MERRAYVISGRVQGVGFRWFTRKAARELGLSGTVRNARNGDVEVEAFGLAEALDRFEAALEEGPAAARVESFQRTKPSGASLPDGFEIVR